MADMFGAPIGIIASDENYRRNVRSDLDTAVTLGELSMQPLKQRELTAKVETAETALSQEKAFQQMLARSAEGDQLPDPVARLEQLAAQTINSGLVVKGSEIAKTAAELRQKQAQTASAEATQRLNAIKQAREQTELIGQVFGAATDPESWATANALYSMQTGQRSPFADVPFSPELPKRLNEVSLSAKERADLETRRIMQESTKTYRDAVLAGNAASREIARERLRVQEEAEARRGKAVGDKSPVLRAPSDNEQKEVKRQLELAGVKVGGMDSASVKSTTFQIASRARALQQANKALSSGEAISQAVQEAQLGGELEVVKEGGTSIGGVQFGGTQKFKGKKEGASAQALPSDRNALKTGTIYNTAQGKAKYIGNGRFVTVGD